LATIKADTRGEDNVKPAPFAYARARSLDHAIELITEDPESTKVLAGGQSLIATLNMRLSAPSLLVDINGLNGLKGISRTDGFLEIGALVRQREAERSPDIARYAPLFAKALPHIAHPAVRNRGTIGGSIAFADPAAELPACLLALDGEVEIAGPAGRRTIKAEDFFKGLFETALTPSDVLTAIRLPVATANSRIGFAELARRQGDYALVGLAAAARKDGYVIRDVRLAFFGVGTTPTRARKAEAEIAGRALDKERIDAATAALTHDLDPASDVHASSAARKHLAAVLLKRVALQLGEPMP
jgi:aerobic carbon-monoxide dehydrogenase medium subunit